MPYASLTWSLPSSFCQSAPHPNRSSDPLYIIAFSFTVFTIFIFSLPFREKLFCSKCTE